MGKRFFRGSPALGRWAPALLLALALALRLYGLDWDGGHLLHPDERAVLWCVSDLGRPEVPRSQRFCGRPEAPWDPDWYPYGSLPLYLLKGIALAWEAVGGRPLEMQALRLPGRALSALADTATVGVVLVLGLRLFGRPVGLLAGAFTALSVLLIQLAHFYTVEALLTLFSTLSLGAMAWVAVGGGLRASALAGALMGLALAVKVSALPLAVPLLLAHLLAPAPGATPTDRLARRVGGLWVAGGCALLAFGLASPYALLNGPVFLEDTLEQVRMARRAIDLPYTRQYIHTAPYLYPMGQVARFGLGLPLGALVWPALALALLAGAWALLERARGIRDALPPAQKGLLLLGAWAGVSFLAMAGQPVKFLRYLAPILPALNLLTAWLLWGLVGTARAWFPRAVPWAKALVALTLAGALFYALAFVAGVYGRPHPAVRMGEWLARNAPAGAVLLKEHWDEAVPGTFGRFRVQELPMYDPDTPEKMERVARALAEADYLVLYSQRLYSTIPRLPERYPLSSRFYAHLFRGDLGYRLVHLEASYPSLAGLAFVNDTFHWAGLPVPAEMGAFRPAFFTLRMGWAEESFVAYDHPLVLAFRRVEALTPEEALARIQAPVPPEAGPLELTPAERTARRVGGTGPERVALEGLPVRAPLLVWLAALYVLGLLASPLAWWLFRPLGDRGHLLGRALGLLLVSWLAWLGASVDFAPFSRPTVALALVLVGAGSLAVLRFRREEMDAFLRGRWRLLLAEEALFLVAFLSFLALRWANPDLWHPYRGGEKPMDLAYLNAVVRSAWMPPYDPWFVGGYIHYYYFGQVMAGSLVLLTRVPTHLAYNLLVPTFFALVVGGAFSLGFGLAWARWPGRLRKAVGVGLASALLVGVAGNLDGAVQLLQGAWEALHGRPFPAFDYWRSSRMMPPDPPGFEITEFPFFTFLFADLHAHMLAMPLHLMALALGLRLWLGDAGRERSASYALAFLALALTVSALWATNAWDFPTYLGLAGLTVAVGAWVRRGGGAPDGGTLFRAGLRVALLVGLALLLFQPYFQRTESFYNRVHLSGTQTALWQYLGIHGLFVFVLVPWVLWALGRGLGGRLRRPGALVAGAVLLAGVLTAGLVGYLTASLLLLLALACALEALRRLAQAPAGAVPLAYPLLLAGLGFALGAGVDLFTVEGDIERMNTVFKIFFQAWVLLALASAFALGDLELGWALRPPALRRAWQAGLALLVLSVSVYPVLGTRARLGDRFQVLPPTLDGTAFMEVAVYQDPNGPMELRWERDALGWLWKAVEGTPVVLEGVTPIYRWGGRVSAYTGLPTVIGWEWHQIQQRWAYRDRVLRRVAEVNAFYSTADPERAQAVLDRYGVEWVVVGQVERLYYPPEGLAKLERMPTLHLAYENPGVRIYRVVPAEGRR